MIRTLLEAALVAGSFALLAVPALGAGRWRWIALAGVLGLGYAWCLFLPLGWPVLGAFNGHWNELGKAFSITFTSIAAVVLIRSGGFRSTDVGLAFAQAPGTARAVLYVILPFLLLVAALVWFLSPPAGLPDHEQLAFEATLPGIDEEFFFRGVMLAVFDRMFPVKTNVLGARLGYGAVATSLVFGLLHAVAIDRQLHVAFYVTPGVLAAIIGLVLAWIRARTQSLLLPVLTHNAVNLLNDVVPVLH